MNSSKPMPSKPSVESLNSQVSSNMTFGIISMILGIFAIANTIFIGGVIFGPLAILFFVLALIKQPRGKVFAIIGAVLGLIGIILSLLSTTPQQLLSLKPDEPTASELRERAVFDSKKNFAKGEVARFRSFDVSVNNVSQRQNSDKEGYDMVSVDVTIKNISDQKTSSPARVLKLKVGNDVYASEAFVDRHPNLEPNEEQVSTLNYLVKKGTGDPKAIQYWVEHVHDVYSKDPSAYVDLVWSLEL